MLRASLVALTVCASAALASAQPAPIDDVGPYGGPSGTAPTQPPQPMQVGAPLANPHDPWHAHRGVTLEGNLGLGYSHVSPMGTTTATDTQAGLGLGLGVGGFLTPQLAVMFRFAEMAAQDQYISSNGIGNAFVGIAAQYWLSPRVWLGGGLGFGVFATGQSGCDTNSGDCTFGGVAFDARAGVVLYQHDRHTLNLSLEIIPATYKHDEDSWSATSSSLVLGYQFL